MKTKFIITLISLYSSLGFAQQIPQYSQYLRNQFLLNPGATGVYDFLDITLGGRSQWTGFNNSPGTIYLAMSSPIQKKSSPKFNPSIRISDGLHRNPEINTGKLKHAFGGLVIADQYGAFRTFHAAGTYALHLPISDKYNLSFGTKIGLSNNTFIPDKAKVLSGSPDNSYETYIANGNSRNIMDLGAGLYFYSKELFVGFSTDHLTKDFVNFGNQIANFERKMHFNLTAGYKFQLNNDWTLTPAALIKFMKPAPASIETTLLVEYKEFLWFGASYRIKDAIIGMIGCNVNQKLKIGYSFDYSVSRMNHMSSGGHEIILGLMIGR